MFFVIHTFFQELLEDMACTFPVYVYLNTLHILGPNIPLGLICTLSPNYQTAVEDSNRLREETHNQIA